MRFKLMAVTVVLSGLLAGCTNKINLLYSTDEGKIVLNPKQGDVLVWKNAKGEPVTTVKFTIGNPCKSAKELAEGVCTIAVPDPKAVYDVTYHCEKCADPEIVVGSETSGLQLLSRGTGDAPTGVVRMACVEKQVTLDPSDIDIPKVIVDKGAATVKWKRAGIPTFGEDWSAEVLSSICSNGSTFNKDNDTCNLKIGATTTSFKVSASSCSSGSATGTIRIQ